MIQTSNYTIKSIYANKIMLLFSFIVFFQPLMLWDRIPFNFFFRLLQFGVWTVIFVSSLIRIKKWSTYLWIWTFFCFVQIVVILCNGKASDASPDTAIGMILSYLFLLHFLDIFFSRCGRQELFFFWKYLFIMLILELITIPLCKMGIISIYWLGIKTRATEPIIAFLLVSLILKDKMGKGLFYVGIALSVFIVFELRISTGIIGLILIGGCYWLINKTYLKCFLKLLQPASIIIFTALLTIGVIFFEIQTRFSTLFEVVFSKDITFSGRTELWEYGISMLTNYDRNHQLWGFGFYNIPLWCKWEWYTIITESHNQLLQLLHDTGIVGTIMLYLVWFFQLRGLNRCNNTDIRNTIACVCFTMLIMCITEIYFYHSYFLVIFSIAARSRNLVQNLDLYKIERRKIV